jgi:hypothetical protein
MNRSDSRSKKKAFVPTNSLTIGFCIFEGALLSFPAGAAMQKWLSYPGSGGDTSKSIYDILFFASFMVLPFWSIPCVLKYRPLGIIGFLTFFASMAYVSFVPTLNAAH